MQNLLLIYIYISQWLFYKYCQIHLYNIHLLLYISLTHDHDTPDNSSELGLTINPLIMILLFTEHIILSTVRHLSEIESSVMKWFKISLQDLRACFVLKIKQTHNSYLKVPIHNFYLAILKGVEFLLERWFLSNLISHFRTQI